MRISLLFSRSFLLILISSFIVAGCSNLPWQKQYSGIQVQMTDGTPTQVFLDNLHIGQAPLEKRDIRPGTYALRLEPQDAAKQPYETQIHLYPNTLTSILWKFQGSEKSGTGDILELEPLASSERAELSVTTVPEGAKISLHSQSYGLSPVIVDTVQPGQYTLGIEAVAHVKKALAVQLQPGFRLHVFSRLEKEAAALENTPLALPNALTSDPPSSQGQEESTPSAARRRLPPQEPTKPYVTILETPTGWLRVRSEASSAGTEVARVDVGDSYPYRSTVNGWYEIEYEPGKTGWISGQYAEIVR